MKHRIPMLVAAVASMLAITAGSALATIPGTLDAQQTGFDHVLAPPPALVAQTFVPTLTGALGTVELNTALYIAGPSVVVGPNLPGMTVQITGTDGSGNPTSTILAAETLAPVAGWNTVTFASPTNVVAGTKYAILLSQAALGTIQWNFACADNYGPGKALVFDTTWKTIFDFNQQVDCLADFAFRTYIVVAAPLPTPDPTNTPPPTSTGSSNSGDTPSNPGYLLIFAGLAAAASAAVFVSISRRRLT